MCSTTHKSTVSICIDLRSKISDAEMKLISSNNYLEAQPQLPNTDNFTGIIIDKTILITRLVLNHCV